MRENEVRVARHKEEDGEDEEDGGADKTDVGPEETDLKGAEGRTVHMAMSSLIVLGKKRYTENNTDP